MQGWDNYTTLWQTHDGFPDGFARVRDAVRADRLGGVGVWLSPWGGYGHARGERMKYGSTQGFETNKNGILESDSLTCSLFPLGRGFVSQPHPTRKHGTEASPSIARCPPCCDPAWWVMHGLVVLG